MKNRNSTTTTLRLYLENNTGAFIVPSYQRGYIWGKYREGEKDSAENILSTLTDAFSSGDQVFLQGVTVARCPDGLEIVDGQQRTTFFFILLKWLGYAGHFSLLYETRPESTEFLENLDFSECDYDPEEEYQDIFFFKKTVRTIALVLGRADMDRRRFMEFILDNVCFLYIELNDSKQARAVFKMMNGVKSEMMSADIIKADILRRASDSSQPFANEWELVRLRSHYAMEWDKWVHWWNRAETREFFGNGGAPLDLLIKLCLRTADSIKDCTPLSYEEFRRYISLKKEAGYHAAKHVFDRIRRVQRRFEDAYGDSVAYNRIRAILLLQDTPGRLDFLFSYFVGADIGPEDLERYYKLSFLGMSVQEIRSGASSAGRFEGLLASLSMSDVYHTDAKKDVFNLLLRLNIDEDIKLGRKFDFSIWNNRSLEHIYAKSKVWHYGKDGRILDGNDNPIHGHVRQIRQDGSFLYRGDIVNLDGMQLSEHCIGNLVLLYGVNNSAFGNSTFGQKKTMFLSPGDKTVFRSRNLLHSVCVFARDHWDGASIIENYNAILKNLKTYYGYK